MVTYHPMKGRFSTMNPTLQFFYDVSSPYSYLTFARIADVAEHYGVSVDYRPFLLGGVFHATNNQTPTTNLARAAYLRKDLARWAARDGILFRFSDSFPHRRIDGFTVRSSVVQCVI